MGIFTREEEELRVYDGEAFFYFAGTMLLVLLLPWTYVLARRLSAPRPPADADFDARGPAPAGAVVRRCTAAPMEARRQAALEAARAWPRRLRAGGNWLQLAVVAALWVCLGMVVLRLLTMPENLKAFDPYEILGLPPDATAAQIKKAYRVKSLQHHPDKDRDNPLAPALFQQISKAHAALTDEGARRNYEKFGNPDGPVQMKVGIALHPAILGSRESQMTTLVLFNFVLFAVPLSLVCCCLRGSQLSAGSVSNETLRTFHACIDSEVRAEDGPGLLAASTEARLCSSPLAGSGMGPEFQKLVEAMVAAKPQPLQPGVLVAIRAGNLRGRRGILKRIISQLCCEVEVWPEHGVPKGPEEVSTRELPASDLCAAEPRIPCPFSDMPIRRACALLWAHMWRLHAKLGPVLEAELMQLLHRSVQVGRAMISIAAHGRGDRSSCFEALVGLVEFRRRVVQALDLDDSPLLQLPHVARLPSGAGTPSLREVVDGAAEKWLDKLGLTPQQRLDVQAFCSHAPKVELHCEVEVLDEPDISEGDLATLNVTLVRTTLKDGEAVGPVYAPLFPCPKFEEWWIVVYDDRSRRLVTADVILGTGRVETCKIRFLVPRAGDFRWTVHALCDSYAGLDAQRALQFRALRKSQVDRKIFVHPEDANIKTLFEELMEGLQQPEEESESEEDLPRPPAKKPAPPVAAVAAVAAPEPPAAATNGHAVEGEGDGSEAAPAPTALATQTAAPQADSDSDSDDEGGPVEVEPDGVIYRVLCETGALIFREPVEDEGNPPMGCVPTGTLVRGFVGDGRPAGWLELAPRGQAWIRTGEGQAEELGPLAEQPLRMVVQTNTPLRLVKRWSKASSQAIVLEDVSQLLEIDDHRVRLVVEEIVRARITDAEFEKLRDQALAKIEERKKRLSKALGHFATQNGYIWHVTPLGSVRGLHPDGSRIRDKVEVGAEKGIQIGPFRLDETRTCSCIHWMRQDDPTGERSWVWQKDQTLRTRVRLGSAF